MKSAIAVSIPSAVFVALGLLTFLHFIYLFLCVVSFSPVPLSIHYCRLRRCPRERERESGLFLLSFPCFVHSCRVDRSWMWLLLCFLFDIAVGFVHVVYVFCCLVSCFSVWHMSMEWRICVVRRFAIVFQGPVVLARLSFDVFAGRFWT